MDGNYEGPPFVSSLKRRVPEFFSPSLSGAFLALFIAIVAMGFGIFATPQAEGWAVGLISLLVSGLMCRNVETITVYVKEETPPGISPSVFSVLRESLFMIGGFAAAWVITDIVIGAFALSGLPILAAGAAILYRWGLWRNREKRKSLA